MEFTAKLIAETLNGEVEGNPDVKVTKPARIEEGKPGSLCFLANPKYEKHLYTSKASVVLINKDFNLQQPVKATLIRVDDAYKSIAIMLDLFDSQKRKHKGRQKGAKICLSAKKGKNCYIGANSYIGKKAKIGNNVKIFPLVYVGDNVEIGDNTILYPNVSVYQSCKIGKDCIIHAGAVIGSDGFGFAQDEDKNFKKIPQLGNVIVEDDVEIGANTTVDRATMGSTVIRKGAKIDNLVQIAHNVEIGERTGMAAHVGISGSTKIGSDCIIAGQVGIAGHLNIANQVTLGAQAGLANSVSKEGSILLGSPAWEVGTSKRVFAVMKKLPELYQKIGKLEKELEALKNQK